MVRRAAAHRAAAFLRYASSAQSQFPGLSPRPEEATRATFWAPSLWRRVLFAVPPVALGTWIAVSDDPAQRVSFTVNFPLRLARDLGTIAAIVTGDFPEHYSFRASSILQVQQCLHAERCLLRRNCSELHPSPCHPSWLRS